LRQTKRGRRRALVVALTALAVLSGAAPARAEPAPAEYPVIEGAGIMFDLIFVRPLGVGRILFGAATFLPVALFAEVPPALGGDSERWHTTVDEVWQVFVGDSLEATFMTPLGEFQEEW
jgi:hypothetical protein